MCRNQVGREGDSIGVPGKRGVKKERRGTEVSVPRRLKVPDQVGLAGAAATAEEGGGGEGDEGEAGGFG